MCLLKDPHFNEILVLELSLCMIDTDHEFYYSLVIHTNSTTIITDINYK